MDTNVERARARIECAQPHTLLEPMALNPIALGVFGSYFGIIIALFAFIARSLITLKPTGVTKCALARTRIWLFIALTIVSFLHTWYCEHF